MPDDIQDANNPEGQQDVDPSTTNQTTDDSVSEDAKTPSEDKEPPFHEHPRWQQLQEEKAQLEERLAILEASQSQEEDKEPTTWQEAEKRAVEKATAKVRAELQEQAKQEAAEGELIEKGFENLKRLGNKITPKIKSAILRDIVKTGDTVYDAFIRYQTQTQKQTQAQQQKAEAGIPSSQRGTEASAPAFSYKDIHGKDPMEIAKEAAST